LNASVEIELRRLSKKRRTDVCADPKCTFYATNSRVKNGDAAAQRARIRTALVRKKAAGASVQGRLEFW
jgi:hypothetical protein